MNRWWRRHTKTATGKVKNIRPMLPAGPADSDQPSTQIAHAVCRSCARRKEVFLPGRICGHCIEQGLLEAQRRSDAALLQALEDEVGDEE